MAVNNKNYIKEYSWSGFKSGVKYSSYLYLGATIASLFVGLLTSTAVPMFPFALLVLNPVAWVTLGAIFAVLSAAAISVAKPLFHWAKDSINQRKFEKGEDQGREKVVDRNEKRPEPILNTNVEVESPNSLLENDVSVNSNKLFYSKVYNTLVHNVNNGKYTSWLSTNEIDDIAKAVYGYDTNLNFEDISPEHKSYGMAFGVVGNIKPNSPSTMQVGIEEAYLQWYREEIEKTKGPRRQVLTLILEINKHYVTLVIARDKGSGNFRAYYCDSFGNPIQDELSDFLKQKLGLKEENIRSCKVRQQNNGYDCGIYALENAKKITDMMKEGKSSDKIDEELKGYVYKDQEQEKTRVQGKRKEFAEALMKSVADKSDIELDEKFRHWGDKIVKEKAHVGR